MGAEGGGLSKKQIIIIIVVAAVVVVVALTVTLVLVLKKDDDESDVIGNCDERMTEEQCWAKAYQKADQFISKCNLTEKINLLFGTENMKEVTPVAQTEKQWLCVGQIDKFKNNNGIDFKGMCLQDGPAGVRFASGTSISWQAAINTAATFNKDLMYKVGKAQGEENRMRGVNVALTPCLNMLRNPQGGRVWEAFGDDPYLVGVAGAQVTKGLQEAGVIASVKHFVGNDQETYRKASSSNIGTQALFDVYIEPFARTIIYAHPGSIMAAYNALNNTYCHENKHLLTNILRGILGYKGFLVSDWWAIFSNTSETLNSGVDMNMPGGYTDGPYSGSGDALYVNIGREHSYWTPLAQYIKENKVQEERVTEASSRIIAAMYQMNQMDNYPSVNMNVESKTDERKALQRQAATESQVLLKNDGILPISSNVKKIAIIGSDAFPRDCVGESDNQCQNDTKKVYTGHIPLGFGSGTTQFGYLIDPLKGISELAQKRGIEVLSSGKLNYQIEGNVLVSGVEDIDTAKDIAAQVDYAIVFVSANSGEEYITLEDAIGDRPNLDLWHNCNELVDAVVEKNENTIVVINAPATVNLPFLDKVRAIVFSGFPGAESGNAIADILFGVENPSGHLPYVWADLNDYAVPQYNLEILDASWKNEHRYQGVGSPYLPEDENEKEQYEYTEGLYIGQRWFNKNNKKPIFPFGYGLSYTKFLYNNLKTTMTSKGLTAELSIKNIGSMKGKAVAMMFLTFPDYIGEYPAYILKGFEKVELNPGETKTVTILADEHALSYFSVEANNYVRVNKGIIKVAIGENGDPSQYKLYSEIEANYN